MILAIHQKTRACLAVAIFSVAAFALTTAADAKPRSKQKHYSQRHHHVVMHKSYKKHVYRKRYAKSHKRYAKARKRHYAAVHQQPVYDAHGHYWGTRQHLGWTAEVNQPALRERSPRRAHRRVAHANTSPSRGVSGGFGSSAVVAEARRYIGGNPTGRRSLWCGTFMDMVLRRTGHRGGGNLARAYAGYGQRVSGPQVGAIAVMSRGKRGGHVGVVSGVDAKGNPIVISGNHGGRVAEATYPRGRVIAYVMPGT